MMLGEEKRYGALDFGTNSLRLLVADLDNCGKLKPVVRRMEITRLGRDLSNNKEILPRVMEENLAAAKKLVQEARSLGTEQIFAVATSAVRDAQNREEFLKQFYQQTGIELIVISGEQEASLTYLGVSSVLKDSGFPLIVDLGGGSTEFIWKQAGGNLNCISLDLGAVRMTEKFLPDDPINEEQFKAMQNEINCLLSSKLSCFKEDLPSTLLGVGGTITSLAAVDLGLERYCPEKIHNYQLSFTVVQQLLQKFKQLPLARRKMIIGLQPARGDIIAAGTAILVEIMNFTRSSKLIVSESDILQGIILHFSGAIDR